ncbi:ABC transporter permease [Kiritimatiella glycovorans]|uniref:Oligopeptide transport system permease protein OppB n=1 Tax=Kiritimatiella glycovorans TaxID=1307763 RepID=A0A0G3EC31_9BACT|nr:Oligopeptide transport system permease protein OppB [Kiritimatiella glycovorans]
MIPTVFGVILITFILFNVVGGSPAAMTLGKNVSGKMLEEFDEQRGFNKPLIFGWRTGTRAYEDTRFETRAGPWREVDDVSYRGGEGGVIRLEQSGSYELPLAFELRPDTEYEWRVEYRLEEGTGHPAHFCGRELRSGEWERARIRCAGSDPQIVRTAGRALEFRSIRLRRMMPHPFDSQFVYYLGQILRLDFGTSLSMKEKVSTLLLNGIGPSLMLTVPIFLAGLVVSVVLALLCAFFRDTWVDRFFVVLAVALMSVNYLVWIVAGQYVFAYRLGWFPVWGFESWRYLLLPVLIGVISSLGMNLRFYRTVVLDEMYRDYVRTARAKGVSRTRILFTHVLKNAMVPIITNVVIAIPFLYTGSLLLESFFGIPGLGYLGVNAINSSDVDVMRALVLLGAIMFVVANLLTDICYAWVDPRVKLR